MVAENQKIILENNPEDSAVPESELFVVPPGDIGIHEELSERQVFAGDEDFYKRLADSIQSAAIESPHAAGATQFPPAPIRYKRFSTLQKALIICILVIAAMLLYASLKSSLDPVAGHAPTSADRIAPAAQSRHAGASPKPPVEGDPKHRKLSLESQDAAPPLTSSEQQIQGSEPVFGDVQPLSLKVAETFYLQKDYDKAYAAYDRLRQILPSSQKNELLKDFLQLKKAFCMEKAASSSDHTSRAGEEANRLFRMASKSRSPVVRAVANYHLSLIEMQKKQYLRARTRAYQTIALTDAVDYGGDLALSLQRDCHFLVAESITRDVLSLCDADKDLPEDLWSNPDTPPEPFTNLSEAQLRSFLNSGSEQLSKGLFGPQIQKIERQGDSPPRWSVICHGAPIEELLARFAANAGLDIHCEIDNWQSTVGKRPVSLYLPEATSQQFVGVAAGCVGLLAHLDEKKTVTIFNPDEYSSLAEHISLLSQEAISLWQTFLLMFHGDKRIVNAHFALGLLQPQRGRITESIAEYKLVANRFSQSSLTPFALLHSSRLKTNLRDYFGAREDLKQLVEQYPDTDISSRACLYLADATMKAGLKTEAARLYRKVYNLGLSLEAQTASALGAGRCFYEEKDYENAATWLTRYFSLATDHANRDSYSAYFLLGKTNLALGNLQQACEAFQHSLAGQLSSQEYVETVSALVEAQMQQERFVEALDVLENVHSWRFSQREFTEILLLKSKIFRAMGLADNAIAALGDRAEYISDSQLKAEVSFELTKCHIAKGNLELARSSLTEILVLVAPGPLAHKITLELADVCLKLGQNSQAISICSRLLDSDPSSQIKQKALSILAAAYNRQKNYDRAALALLGRWSGTVTKNEKSMSDSPVIKGQSLGEAR